MKSIPCTIYGPMGKKILNVTTVELLPKNKIQCFLGFLLPFCFKLYSKVNIHPFHCLKMASKISNISKFTKELEILANWTVDGTQYTKAPSQYSDNATYYMHS